MAKRIGSVALALTLLVSYNVLHLPKAVYDSLFSKNTQYQVLDDYKLRYADFYEQLDNLEDRLNTSVLLCSQDISEYDRIHINYLSEGTAINLCKTVNPEEAAGQILRSHATHVFVCPGGEYTEADYQSLMAEGKTFAFGVLYQVTAGENGVVLS